MRFRDRYRPKPSRRVFLLISLLKSNHYIILKINHLQQHDVRQLRTIQQRHLRLILNIKWDYFVSNEEVLKREGVEDTETMLIRSRLRWLGHICRMDDTRAPKQLMYGELARGSRPVGRPKLRFRDTCKNALKCWEVLNGWQSFVN